MAQSASPPLSIAAHIDALRDDLGLSVADLAELVERDRSHLWRMLTGRISVSPDIVARCLIELAGAVQRGPEVVLAERRAGVVRVGA